MTGPNPTFLASDFSFECVKKQALADKSAIESTLNWIGGRIWCGPVKLGLVLRLGLGLGLDHAAEAAVQLMKMTLMCGHRGDFCVARCNDRLKWPEVQKTGPARAKQIAVSGFVSALKLDEIINNAASVEDTLEERYY